MSVALHLMAVNNVQFEQPCTLAIFSPKFVLNRFAPSIKCDGFFNFSYSRTAFGLTGHYQGIL
jgi:hypothetical protein